MNTESPRTLEEKMGYQFKNVTLLQTALTHPSFRHESASTEEDNQRLEFLGDAALDLAAAANLFVRFPHMPEGTLTELRSRLTNSSALARIGQDLGVGDLLHLGRGEEASGGRTRDSNLTDAVEALIGAIYLDGGHCAVADVFQRLWADHLDESELRNGDNNPKGHLQELCQARWKVSPVYEITAQSGPDHAREYTVTVLIRDAAYGTGTGPNKRTAEMEAAKQAMTRLADEQAASSAKR